MPLIVARRLAFARASFSDKDHLSVIKKRLGKEGLIRLTFMIVAKRVVSPCPVVHPRHSSRQGLLPFRAVTPPLAGIRLRWDVAETRALA